MSIARQPAPSPNEVAALPQATVPPPDTSCCDRQLRHSERLASLGILAAGVAHEILNPLASVLAGVEALRRRILATPVGSPLDSPAEAERILNILERETIRARGIADSMMLLARPDTEVPAWLDVNRAVEETIGLLRYQMNLQSVHISLDLDRELAPIWAMGGGVRSVCMNLMMNAVQAMARGGTLTVRTRGRDGTVLVEVEDTGPGIPTDRLGRIWDPFYTTKPPGEGTGLGLPISQTIVQRHGGSIKVENVEPRGARFTVELPIRFRR
jgi:signal transduction histidine kinase